MKTQLMQKPRIIERNSLQALFDVLTRRGHRLIGPRVRSGAVVYDEIQQVSDLPVGWIDHQSGGTYRLEKTEGPGCFRYTVAPQSWKQYLHLPKASLWEATPEDGGFRIVQDTSKPPKRALIGVRACELAAIAIQDKIFLQGPYVDEVYRRQRENLFVVAVNCTRVGGTCFCASMGTGPKATSGYDLALTELVTDDRHIFLAEACSKAGSEVLNEVATEEAGDDEIAQATAAIENAATHMGRELDTDGLKERLYRVVEHPHWAEIAERCLTCGNCTMVCPTCFCTTIEDSTTLGGEKAERIRRWDSCFTVDFSYIYGGSIRPSASARYRQWMTHKLASWVDQFGTFGCVGCGRCITWCPVGIDITEEAKVFAKSLERADAQT